MSKKTRYFLRIDPESLIGLISMTAAANPDQSSSLVIYMRLLMESAPYGGVIKLDQDNPLDLDRWAHRLNVGEDVLSAALKRMSVSGLITETDGCRLCVNDHYNCVRSETDAAARMRRRRARASDAAKRITPEDAAVSERPEE